MYQIHESSSRYDTWYLNCNLQLYHQCFFKWTFLVLGWFYIYRKVAKVIQSSLGMLQPVSLTANVFINPFLKPQTEEFKSLNQLWKITDQSPRKFFSAMMTSLEDTPVYLWRLNVGLGHGFSGIPWRRLPAGQGVRYASFLLYCFTWSISTHPS